MGSAASSLPSNFDRLTSSIGQFHANRHGSTFESDKAVRHANRGSREAQTLVDRFAGNSDALSAAAAGARHAAEDRARAPRYDRENFSTPAREARSIEDLFGNANTAAYDAAWDMCKELREDSPGGVGPFVEALGSAAELAFAAEAAPPPPVPTPTEGELSGGTTQDPEPAGPQEERSATAQWGEAPRTSADESDPRLDAQHGAMEHPAEQAADAGDLLPDPTGSLVEPSGSSAPESDSTPTPATTNGSEVAQPATDPGATTDGAQTQENQPGTSQPQDADAPDPLAQGPPKAGDGATDGSKLDEAGTPAPGPVRDAETSPQPPGTEDRETPATEKPAETQAPPAQSQEPDPRTRGPYPPDADGAGI